MLRNSLFHTAKIIAKQKVSPTVVVLDLILVKDEENSSTTKPSSPSCSLASDAVANNNSSNDVFTFHPGQWVDFYVPSQQLSWVGGFSLASIPQELPYLTLAVKQSRQSPAAQWVHSYDAQVGQDVQLRVGGSCVLDVEQHIGPVVFCAGGIGISPLLSMFRQWCDHWSKPRRDDDAPSTSPSASFFYSVTTADELVFAEQLLQQQKQPGPQKNASNLPPYDITFTLTQQESWDPNVQAHLQTHKDDVASVTYRTGRVLQHFLQQQTRQTKRNDEKIFYLCGPPPMLEEGVHLLQQRGVPDHCIRYEKWW